MNKHTFVICAYKKSPYLEKCIRSLKQQKEQSNIIIVTSTPSGYIASMAKKYELRYFVNHGQGGITQDWNFGYKCARDTYKSEYITIAHQDDVYENDYLLSIKRKLEKVEHPLIIFTDYYEIRDEKKILANTILRIKRLMLFPLRLPYLDKSKWMRRRILSFGSPICCPSVTFAVNNLPKVVFENHYRACEDWEAWEKISKLKGEFIYIPHKLVGHRIHEESETTAAIGDNKRTVEEFQMFCKFWPKIIAKILVGQYSKSQKSNKIN